MKVAAEGKYWVRVNNLTTMKTQLTSYNGYNTLKEAKEVRDKWSAAMLALTAKGKGVYSVSVEDKDGNVLYPEV